jgi:hypothetical protein
MANLKKILNLAIESRLSVEQAKLLINSFFDNHNTRPEWLYRSEEAEIISLFKTEGKLHAVKALKDIARMRMPESTIFGLRWCKEYVERICDKL